MNKLYDGLKVENNFRYADLFTCEGSFATAANGSVPLTITHPETPVTIDLNQFPGADVAYLYLRRASFSNNITTAGNFSVLTIDYQANSGSNYGLCIYDTRDNGMVLSVDKLFPEPATNATLVNNLTGASQAGNLIFTQNAVNVGGTVYYQLTFSVAYQLVGDDRLRFIEERMNGIEKSIARLLELQEAVKA